MFPGLGENDPQTEGGQVEQLERWAITQLFHGYDASHVVSPLPSFSSHSLSCHHGDDSGEWGRNGSERCRITITLGKKRLVKVLIKRTPFERYCHHHPALILSIAVEFLFQRINKE
ncbi:hypothetical protein TNCV_4795731 [Trichonephila clavipes]|nr:hypothetical protein TNCV_4795731 [Trichonephila clavipes]